MSDAAGFGVSVKTAKLLREIDADECRRRNALSNKRADLRLSQGSKVTVLESLDQGRAFLVEFGEQDIPAAVPGPSGKQDYAVATGFGRMYTLQFRVNL